MHGCENKIMSTGHRVMTGLLTLVLFVLLVNAGTAGPDLYMEDGGHETARETIEEEKWHSLHSKIPPVCAPKRIITLFTSLIPIVSSNALRIAFRKVSLQPGITPLRM